MMTLYHGTDKNAGMKILGTQSFYCSMGNEHWLGDGIYFYQDQYYAFRWIYLAYCRKFRDCVPTLKNIKKRYEILAASVDLKSDRIFDMTNKECEMVFKKVLKESRDKIKNRNPKLKIIDGAVFNILFYKIGYRENYDAIKAIFIHEDKTMSHYNTRFYYTPEIQYCIVNKKIISKIWKERLDTEDTLFEYAKEYDNNTGSSVIQYASANKIKYRN